MAITLNDLVRGQLDSEAQLRADLRFQIRGDMRVAADRTRDLAYGDVVRREREPDTVPAKLVEPDRQLEPKGGWLGVHAVGAADGQRPLVLASAPGHDALQDTKLPGNELGRIPRLHSQAGIDNIGGCQAEMDVAGRIPDRLPGGAQKRDHVMVGFAFDLAHPGQIAGRESDAFHCIRRYAAAACPRLADGDLHREPRPDLRLIGPERAHLGPGIAIDQRCVPLDDRATGRTKGQRAN